MSNMRPNLTRNQCSQNTLTSIIWLRNYFMILTSTFYWALKTLSEWLMITLQAYVINQKGLINLKIWHNSVTIKQGVSKMLAHSKKVSSSKWQSHVGVIVATFRKWNYAAVKPVPILSRHPLLSGPKLGSLKFLPKFIVK